MRYSATLTNDQWFYIVRDGLLQVNGMPGFGKELSRADAAAVRSYVILRANRTKPEGAGQTAAAR